MNSKQIRLIAQKTFQQRRRKSYSLSQVRVYNTGSNSWTHGFGSKNAWTRGIDLLHARAAPCAVAVEEDGVVIVTGGGEISTFQIK